MARRGNSEGTIRQRKDGTWEARITVAVTRDGTAKQRSFYGKTRAEVAAKLREAQEKLASGKLVDPNRLSVGDWLHRWIGGKRNVTTSTLASYHKMAVILARQIGAVPLQKLKPLHIKEAYLAIADEGYSPRTQRYCAMVLRAALTEALELQLTTHNPAMAVKVSAPRVERGADAWTREEVATFLRAAKGELRYAATGGRNAKGKAPEVVAVGPEDASPHWHYPAFYLMLTLGLRLGEVLGLMWRDIDWDSATLRIERTYSLTGEGGKCELKTPKTANSARSLYLPHDAMAVLQQHRERVLELFSGTLPLMVTCTHTGSAVDPNNLRRAFNTLCAIANVRPVRLHDLRHTYASLALQHGVPVELVSERLGHTNVGFTLAVYRHLYDSERKQAALSLDELLGNVPRVVN
jgi:integrase